MCAPYFLKEHFSVKTILFVHLRSQQKRTEKVIPSYQIYNFTISTLLFESSKLAIISNVQNVRLQRRHKPSLADRRCLHLSMAWFTTDWSSSHHTEIRHSRSSSTSLTMLWYTRCTSMPFCTFFSVSVVQKLLKSVKIWLSSSQMYTAAFYEPQQKCSFFLIFPGKVRTWIRWCNKFYYSYMWNFFSIKMI